MMCSKYNNLIYSDPKEQKESTSTNDIPNSIHKFGLNWNMEHCPSILTLQHVAFDIVKNDMR